MNVPVNTSMLHDVQYRLIYIYIITVYVIKRNTTIVRIVFVVKEITFSRTVIFPDQINVSLTIYMYKRKVHFISE